MNESLVYVACFVDCEGSIQLQLTKNSACHLWLTLHNTCRDVIDYINQLFPGHMYVESRRSPKHKVCYRLSWNGQDAIDILELVLPYLRIKGEVASAAIDFWDKCDIRGIADKQRVITEAEAIIRRSYRDKMKDLNRRGIDESMYVSRI